ncbi:endonuclease/exonuclease/phosphatase family protein [Acetobacteraceae bacterium]|nr:endonuclease/exonuclease/phosphatase family protein [Acetobacteraceae bacterium]
MKIVTWNMNWLLSNEALNQYKLPEDIPYRSPKDWAKLQYYAQKLSADIILLQEVDSTFTAEKIFPSSQYKLYQTDLNIPQKEILAVKKSLNIEVEQNKDLESLSENPEGYFPLRPGLDAFLIFPNQKKIRLLGVHLKAGCWERPQKEKKHSCLTLSKQFQLIKRWAQQSDAENQDFIILGDFNRRLSKTDFLFQEISTNLNKPLTLTSENLASPCKGGEYFIDHILINNGLKKNFVPQSLKVQIIKQEDENLILSGHCPVSIKLNF